MSEPTEGEEIPTGEEDPNEAAIAWAEEIRSRVDDIRSGRVKVVPGAEVSAAIRALRDGANP